MKPLERLRRLRKAQRLYNQLATGETALLDELFPFVRLAFTPKVVELPQPQPQPSQTPPQPLRKPPPKVSYRSRSEEDDLRDALSIGFSALTFDAPNGTAERPTIKKLGEK
jgi:hypothetical protein